MKASSPQAPIRDVAKAADLVLDAQDHQRELSPLTDSWPELDLTLAYRIQDEILSRRLARGEKLIGVKLGLTSVAKQQRMGISSPLVAWLTDAMVLPATASLPRARLIHPRAEPEIVFVLGEVLRGPGVTAQTALRAVESVRAGIEVIDSRYTDYRFALPDVVADNASSAYLVTGGVSLSPQDLDLALEACVLEVDGDVVDRGTGAAVQGHPAEALALAANTLAERDIALQAGWIVLTGGMTDAVDVATGSRVSAQFSHLGEVVVHGGSE